MTDLHWFNTITKLLQSLPHTKEFSLSGIAYFSVVCFSWPVPAKENAAKIKRSTKTTIVIIHIKVLSQKMYVKQ